MKKEPLYIFIHVMKCAGTTISKHLRDNFSEDELLFIYRHVGNLEKGKERENVESYILSLPEKRRKEVKVIIGHRTYYGIHKLFPEKEARYVTFLREPLSRAISHYNFGRTMLVKRINIERHKKFLYRGDKMLSIKDWFFENKVFQNFIFKFLFSHFFSDKSLSIMEGYSIGENEINRENLERVKKVLDKFYFIGITESKADMLFLFQQLGIRKFFYKENVSDRYVKKEEIQKAKNYMYPKLGFDREIYSYALKVNRKFKKENMRFYPAICFTWLRKLLYIVYLTVFGKMILGSLYKLSAKLKVRSRTYRKAVCLIKGQKNSSSQF